MMQSCASAAKLLGGGPILESGVNDALFVSLGTHDAEQAFPRSRATMR
jgi:hypothetical protein